MMNNDSQIDLQAAVSPETLKPKLAKVRGLALGAIGAGLLLTIVSFFLKGGLNGGLNSILQSYLWAYLFWFGLTLGSLAFMLLHSTVGGGWGFVIRRSLEAGSRTFPVMAVLAIPIVFSVFMKDSSIYEWAHKSMQTDPFVSKKLGYLNPEFFAIRTVFYFVVWGVLITLINKWSSVFDERNDPKVADKLNYLGAAGILVHVLVVSFWSFDWAMSLEPHWFSSIYGLLFLVGQGLSTLALMNVINGTIARSLPIMKLVPDRYFRDLGNLMMAIVLVWAYVTFSQYLIQYSGNLAEEVGWFVKRGSGGWGILGISLIFLHFALPFAVLLSSLMKTRPQNTAKIAAFILFMRLVDLMYLTRPAWTENKTLLGSLYFSDLGLLLLLGGIWFFIWSTEIAKRPLLMLHDPRFVDHWKVHEHERLHGEPTEEIAYAVATKSQGEQETGKSAKSVSGGVAEVTS